MNKLILISGDLAAGKTTLTEALSKRIGVLALSKDNIKEILCDEIGFSNREENLNISHGTMQTMFHIFKKQVINNMDLILEANFHKEELEYIFNLAKESNYEVFFLLLTADLHVLYPRFLERCKTRHPAHMSQHLDESFEKYESVCLFDRNNNLEFNPYILDITNLNKQEVIDKVVSELSIRKFVE